MADHMKPEAVPDLEQRPVANDPLAPSAITPVKKKRTRRLLAVGAGAALLGLVFYPTKSEPDVSELPSWFARAHRIRQPASPAHPVPFVPAVGQVLPPTEAPGQLTEAEFENSFTHYTRIPLFVWATPVHVYPSHGKILPGLKVIFGKEINGMTLVCLRSDGDRPLNMFIESGYLRDRSQGPPRQQRDD
jgi:hypothetical protein